MRNRDAPLLLRLYPATLARNPYFSAHASIAQQVMERVASETGAEVLVDSSKSAAHAALLRAAGIDTYVIHLVRDPRAVAYSFVRDGRRPGRSTARPIPRPARSVAAWTYVNLWAEYLGRWMSQRYARVRYEDLVRDPATTVQRILAFAGESGVPPISADRIAEIPEHHAVAGNATGFRFGATAIRDDDEWKNALPPGAWYTTTALSLPMLTRYGYPYLDGHPWRRASSRVLKFGS